MPHKNELTVKITMHSMKKVLPPNHTGGPGAHRQYDRIGHQVRGEDPGALIGTRS